MSYLVTLRKRDIGIHVSLGATPGDVFLLVARPMLGLSGAGLGLGLAVAIAAGSAFSRAVSGVEPHDFFVYAGVVVAVVATAAIAIAIPALRAVRTDPALAVRAE